MVSPEHNKYLVSNYASPAIEVIRGEGTKVWDSKDKEYLDFTTGIAVSNLGHSHPHWVKAVSSQSSKLVHCSNLFSIPGQVNLAKRLVEKIGIGKVLFCNSGAEANEGLIKLARKVPARGEENAQNLPTIAEKALVRREESPAELCCGCGCCCCCSCCHCLGPRRRRPSC